MKKQFILKSQRNKNRKRMKEKLRRKNPSRYLNRRIGIKRKNKKRKINKRKPLIKN